MKSISYSPEFKLLLSCCRVKPSQYELEMRANALKSSINNEHFLFLVKRHLVAPLVFFNLKDEALISDELKSTLRLLAEQNQFSVLIAKQMIIRLQKGI